MYEILPDRSRRMLRINLTGNWDLATMARYEEEVRRELVAMKALGGYKAFLIDTSDLPIQSQEVAARHEALLSAAGRDRPARVAVLMPAGRSKLQASRVASRAGQQTFTSEAEALKWLAASDE